MEEFKVTNEKFKWSMFIIYTILFEAAVWGVWFYLFTVILIPGWTVIIAILMSGAQFKPAHFGLVPYPEEKENDDI